MNRKAFVARRLTWDGKQDTVGESMMIFADNELEARIAAAGAFGVPPEDIDVGEADSGWPTDEELKQLGDEFDAAQAGNLEQGDLDWMRNIHDQ